ncbi:sensor histidine kinase [Actinoplanes aureus]|uniref:histidine kinase n=1 Tax=Actinoplanes aureus TaxID=2792083 RepID=A0A931G0H6_9ACTN|nr:histidine kinase [Actinoplanes aureus]MBG0564076.1 two-component sensor histidine kinase [Actinoplanes aureus]
MSRYVPRHFLTDAALALALIVLTVGPGLARGYLAPVKLGDSRDFLDRTGLPLDGVWWLCAALIAAGLLIRQQWPIPALALAGVGTFGHLMLQSKLALIDLALPLVLYSVAAAARSRRISLALLGLTVVLTYTAILGGRLHHEQQQTAIIEQAARKRLEVGQTGKTPVAGKVIDEKLPAPVLSPEQLVDAGQQGMEQMLLLIVAFAVGDAMRSRRAHLAAVEQRTADLAREERQRAALAVAAERARLTRELHDVVAHGMSVMVVQAQGAAAALDRHPERAATALQHVIEVGRASLAEMRQLLAAGRTDPAEDARLAPLPGIGSVPGLVDQLRSTGMRVELYVDGVPGVVPAAVDLSAYRIVQEGLTNTLKHAGPGAGAAVRLEFEPDRLRVAVADDGSGLADGADGRGNGLRGIAERVAMLGGTLETGHGDGGGFRLRATLPLRVDGRELVAR